MVKHERNVNYNIPNSSHLTRKYTRKKFLGIYTWYGWLKGISENKKSKRFTEVTRFPVRTLAVTVLDNFGA